MIWSLQIKNVGTHNCMDTMGRKSGEEVGLSYCHGLGGNQVFAYTKRQQVMSDDNCMDATQPDHPVKLVRCHGMGGNQAWNYNFEVSKEATSCFCSYAVLKHNPSISQRHSILAFFFRTVLSAIWTRISAWQLSVTSPAHPSWWTVTRTQSTSSGPWHPSSSGKRGATNLPMTPRICELLWMCRHLWSKQWLKLKAMIRSTGERWPKIKTPVWTAHDSWLLCDKYASKREKFLLSAHATPSWSIYPCSTPKILPLSLSTTYFLCMLMPSKLWSVPHSGVKKHLPD